MIAVVFWDRKEPAFANYQTWRAVGYTLVFSFHSFLCVSTKLLIALGFLVVGMIMYTAVEIRIRWKERVHVPNKRDEAAAAAAEAKSARPSHASPVRHGDAGGGRKFDEEEEEEEEEKESPTTTTTTTTTTTRRHASSSPPLSSFFSPAADAALNLELSVNLPSSSSLRPDRHGSLPTFSSFRFEDSDDENRAGGGGQVTLDGTYLAPGESAYLDHDLRRYGIVPAGGSRPLTVTPRLARSVSEFYHERWAEKEDAGDDYYGGNFSSSSSAAAAATAGSSSRPANQQPARPHTWHDGHFQDEGELKVVWTKNDVFVY